MNIRRLVLVGVLIWLLIFFTFGIVSMIPIINGPMDAQIMLVALFITPIAVFGASIYYKNGSRSNGFVVGFIMALVALVLDALITVPLIELPKGNTYGNFYSNPFLWLLVALNIATVYVYWRLKIRNS